LKKDVQQLEMLGAGMRTLASGFRPAVSAAQFLAEFKRYFQIYGEEQYLAQVVRAILDGGSPPSVVECMRAISVNTIPGVAQKAVVPEVQVPSFNLPEEFHTFDFDFGSPQRSHSFLSASTLPHTRSVSSTPVDSLAHTSNSPLASLSRDRAQREVTYLGFSARNHPRYLTPPSLTNDDHTSTQQTHREYIPEFRLGWLG